MPRPTPVLGAAVLCAAALLTAPAATAAPAAAPRAVDQALSFPAGTFQIRSEYHEMCAYAGDDAPHLLAGQSCGIFEAPATWSFDPATRQITNARASTKGKCLTAPNGSGDITLATCDKDSAFQKWETFVSDDLGKGRPYQYLAVRDGDHLISLTVHDRGRWQGRTHGQDEQSSVQILPL
ncbi:hypothetical protein [Streptomyces sp. NPDC058486]|uniref:hypothetical protein n=1 Tax=unclassified Streptomyces TaxID=2593676 RepID=UPI00364824DB